jgi:hypothetical protein
MAFKRVDFPAPFFPTNPILSFLDTKNEIFLKRALWPKMTLKLFIETMRAQR